MADYTVTVAEVQNPTTPATIGQGKAGATITAGQFVYIDASASDVVKPAIATSAAAAAVVGVALHGALSGQFVDYQRDGIFTIGATAAVPIGKLLILSGSTAGSASPHTDATTPATGEYVTFLGTGYTSSTIKLGISVSGIAAA